MAELVKVSVILMGSFQDKIDANDIDLIFIYENNDFDALKELKCKLANAVYDRFLIPVHYTTLSLREFKQMKKLHVERHRWIYKYKKINIYKQI